jgi:hypothetical protein
MWNTQAPATSTLEWGITDTYGTASTTDATSTAHTYTIPTTTCTTYYYQISVADVAHNVQRTSGSFESTGCPEEAGGDSGSSSGSSSHRHSSSPDTLPNIPSATSSLSGPSSPDSISGPTGSTTCPYFIENLRQGSQGEEVSKVQEFLKAQGLFTHPAITQYFGPITESAVKAFQATYADDILRPLALSAPTGWWYEFTRRKADSLLGCQ